MDDRKRNYLFQYMDVIEQHTRQHLGYLTDLSGTGIMFVSPVKIELNQEIDVSLEMNIDGAEVQKTAVPVRIKTLWAKPNLNPELNCVGCEIVNITAEQKAVLRKLGLVLGFEDDINVNRVFHDPLQNLVVVNRKT